ncbi:MAG: hypothetical protein LBU75_11960 [Desulfovibrio sp.]|nr:hypothetical protein [Desulfovibrio sp.]
MPSLQVLQRRRAFFLGGRKAGSGEKEVSRLVECGFYEDSRALLNTLDLVMPPAGKGPSRCGRHP